MLQHIHVYFALGNPGVDTALLGVSLGLSSKQELPPPACWHASSHSSQCHWTSFSQDPTEVFLMTNLSIRMLLSSLLAHTCDGVWGNPPSGAEIHVSFVELQDVYYESSLQPVEVSPGCLQSSHPSTGFTHLQVPSPAEYLLFSPCWLSTFKTCLLVLWCVFTAESKLIKPIHGI